MTTFLWILVWLLVCTLVARELSRPDPHEPERTPAKPEQNPIAKLLGFKPVEPLPPRDYPKETISRTRGPWRRQVLELQKAHNTKQQHLDKLTEAANGKTR
jgi:hypothetical protein